MSALLSGLTTENAPDVQNETDSVGGGGPLESGAYKSTITLAYLQKSRSGALGLHIHFKAETGQEFRQTIYATSGDAKGNKNFYVNKQNEKKFLPGFLHANAICLLTVGKELGNMETEKKVVKLYSFDAGQEVPTEVDALVDLHGQEIIVGLQKRIEDKRAKGDDGQYHATGETREVNEIDKVFRARDGMTTSEIRAKADEATFIETWKEKWTGKTQDRSTKGAGQTGAPAANSGSAGAPSGAAPAADKPKSSLFG